MPTPRCQKVAIRAQSWLSLFKVFREPLAETFSPSLWIGSLRGTTATLT